MKAVRESAQTVNTKIHSELLPKNWGTRPKPSEAQFTKYIVQYLNSLWRKKKKKKYKRFVLCNTDCLYVKFYFKQL